MTFSTGGSEVARADQFSCRQAVVEVLAASKCALARQPPDLQVVSLSRLSLFK